MATPTMQHTVEVPAGTHPRQVKCRVRLVASSTADAHGWSSGSSVAVGGAQTFVPGNDGLVSFTNMRPNSGTSSDVIDSPDGTAYELVTTYPDGRRITDYFTVPDTAGTFWVGDYLTTAPADLTTYILGHPRPLGARVVALGDSITIGSGSTLSTGSFGKTRPQIGSWFARLCGANPDRYYRLNNAGVGGDIPGGYGYLTADVAAGATSVTINGLVGCKPYNVGVAAWVGGYYGGNPDGKFPSTTPTDHGDGTYTITFSSGLTNSHNAGDVVSWGMHARLDDDVLDYDPETVFILAGTNDSGAVSAGTITVDDCIDGIVALVTRLRVRGVEPVLLELLPRSTYASAIAQINDALRVTARQYNLHLIPLWQTFAGSDGAWADSNNTADGLHPSDTGHAAIATQVHSYMSKVTMRTQRVPLAAYDTDPTNLLTHACFLTGAASTYGGYGGYVPTGWTATNFFNINMRPNLAAASGGDGIIGQWGVIETVGAATGSLSLGQSLSTATATNDVLLLSCRVKGVNLAGGCVVSVQFLTGLYSIDLVYQATADFDQTLFHTITPVSASSQYEFRVTMTGNGGTGKVYFAQPYVQNLTQLGRNL